MDQLFVDPTINRAIRSIGQLDRPMYRLYSGICAAKWAEHMHETENVKYKDEILQNPEINLKCKVESALFDTPQVFDFLTVDSDAALLPS